MPSPRVLLLLLCCVAGSASAQSPTHWNLQSLGRVTVDTTVVRLGDVVKPIGRVPPEWHGLSRLVVALVPPDGRGLSLARQRIAEAVSRRLTRDTRALWSGPELIAVVYRAPEAAAESGTSTNTSASSGSEPRRAPETQRAFKVIPTAASSPVAASAAAKTTPAGTTPAGTPAAAPDAPRVVVARRSLRRGDLVSSSDLHWQTLSPDADTTGMVTDLELLVGQEVKSTLHRDRPVRLGDVGPPTLVRRSDLVELSVIGGGIVVRTAARALQDGAQGELIQVETDQPRRRLLARVAAPGAVEILTRPPQVVAERSR